MHEYFLVIFMHNMYNIHVYPSRSLTDSWQNHCNSFHIISLTSASFYSLICSVYCTSLQSNMIYSVTFKENFVARKSPKLCAYKILQFSAFWRKHVFHFQTQAELLKEAAKKVFFSGPTTKVELSVHWNFFFVLKLPKTYLETKRDIFFSKYCNKPAKKNYDFANRQHNLTG